MHRRTAAWEKSSVTHTFAFRLPRQLPTARLVPLLIAAVGQAQAASVLACPTVPPLSALAHVSVAGSNTRASRARVFL